MEENTNTAPETLNVGATETPVVEETVVTPEPEVALEAPIETVIPIHETAEGVVIPPETV